MSQLGLWSGSKDWSRCAYLPCHRLPEAMLLLHKRFIGGFCQEHAESMRVWTEKTWTKGSWRFERV